MVKPTLLLAPTSFEPSLDIRDKITPFKGPAEITAVIADFCPLIVEYSSQVEPSGIDTQTLLEALSIGDPRAENEMPTLGLYYLKTDQFERTVRGEVNLVVALDWSDPDMLREMLRLRLVNGMKAKLDEHDFQAVWRELCISHFKGEESSAYLIDRSLMRPRNVLKIFNHCRGFATNFGRQRISKLDIDKGLTAYSQDLLEELDRELTDVYPGAKDLLYYFLDAPEALTAQRLDSILAEAGIDQQDREKVVDFLLYYGVLGTRLGDNDHFIYSVNYDLKVLKIRAQRHQGTADYVSIPLSGRRSA